MSDRSNESAPSSSTESWLERALPGPLSFPASDANERPIDAPQLAAGRDVSGFRLLNRIGRGGMGEVWVAEQLSLGGRRVALKFVRADRVTPRQLEYFAREARAGGRLAHPGLVSVYASGEAEGLAWIAMELVEGGRTLRGFLEEATRAEELPADHDRRVALSVAEIADAMKAAHDAGVLHRDLKPENVLVTAAGHPKVSDFGLARLTDEPGLSKSGDMAGTYAYMSPEQVAAKRSAVDTRSDVFSLGVVLYELLTLQRPFVGDTSQQVGAQILFKDPPDPRTLRARVSRDLAVIAGKALEKKRDNRYASMAELGSDLRLFLAGEPILARPPGRIERVGRFARRHWVGSVVLAACALAGGSLGVSALLVDRSAERLETTLGVEKRRSDRRAYAAMMQSADMAFGQGLVEDCRAILEQCSEDLRGWEWHHATARLGASEQAHAAPAGVSQRTLAIASDGWMQIDPSGRFLAYGARDGCVLIRVRDAHLVFEFADRYTGFFSFDQYGERLYVPIRDGRCAVVSTSNGIVEGYFGEVEDQIVVASVAMDGSDRIATGSGLGEVRVWSSAGKEWFRANVSASEICDLEFSPDGKRLAVGASGGKAVVLDASTGEVIADMTLDDDRGADAALVVLEWSGDERIVQAVGSFNVLGYGQDWSRLTLWDGEKYSIQQELVAHGDSKSGIEFVADMICYACFSPDGSRMLTVSLGGTIRIWDAESGLPLLVLSGPRGDEDPPMVAWHPDGTAIYAVHDHLLTVWEAGE